MGPAGRHFLSMALNMGARQIIAFEHRAARRDAARLAGADIVVDPTEVETVNEVLGTLDHGGPDVVIDAAGGQSGINQAYQIARYGTTVLRFGLPHGATTVDHFSILLKELTVYHAVAANLYEPNLECFRVAMRLIESDRVDVTNLISHRLPLNRLPEGLALAADSAGSAVKIVIGPM
jgi:threonine dehydrogenase-like Zn-dependent dehydrogenase